MKKANRDFPTSLLRTEMMNLGETCTAGLPSNNAQGYTTTQLGRRFSRASGSWIGWWRAVPRNPFLSVPRRDGPRVRGMGMQYRYVGVVIAALRQVITFYISRV
jgi:hypothetical protein